MADSHYHQQSVPTPENLRDNMERRSSLWSDDDTTIPMTTRPHFPHTDLIHWELLNQSGSSDSDFSHLLLVSPLQEMSHNLPAKKNADSRTESMCSLEGELSTQFGTTDKEGNSIFVSVLYGMINAIIILPILCSFASIIYRDDAFASFIPVLVKLTLVSGVVHQLCFSTFSSMPFAVGQVQDAGLIFLSSMATDIVRYCHENNLDDATLLATVTVGLSLGTALLGIGLVLIGKLRLAQYVKLLPMSVVGGYLAFIGWFCGLSGVGMMAGTSDVSIGVVLDKMEFVLPGLVGGILLYIAVRNLHHMAVLPMGILLVFTLFYVFLWTTNTSVDEATDNGWIRKMDAPPAWNETWQFLRLNKVAWSALPRQALTELGMVLVVSLSSSLDVAAIELEMGSPLDYNRELQMVGLSNIFSGITGGYTGSYIFSQSCFSLRAGIRSRLAGYVLALFEMIIIILPFPILSFIPNCFFAALLIMICIDLMFEWLWDVRRKITRAEHAICIATFGLIQVLGIEYGILAGVGVYLCCAKLGLDVGSTSSDEDELLHASRKEIVPNYGSV